MTSTALRTKVQKEIEDSRKKVFAFTTKSDERLAMDSIRQLCWRITTLEEVLEWLD